MSLQDVMMLGAVGAYGWTGTVVHKTAQTSEIFPKGAFEQILEDKNHSSLLGEWFGFDPFTDQKCCVDSSHLLDHW